MTQVSQPRQRPAVRPGRTGGQAQFRPDIEGLRGIAIGFVLLFHAGVPGWSGGFVGVDVFFVISGFLMTGFVLRQLEQTGRAGFRQFYARRIRRILPAAATVLVATGIASLVVLPWLMWERAGWDLFAAGTFWSNIRFAVASTDYLAADLAPSVVLNYWSLSLEEQFYLVWPGLLLGLWLVARRARRPKFALAALLAALGALSLSLAGGVWLTTVNQPVAFFAMPLRAWEFVIGGLVAISAARLAVLPAAVRATAGVAGLLGLFAAALVTPEAGFPGWWALFPVLTAALLVAGGTPGSQPDRPMPAGRLVGSAPLRAAGRISYSWYLWHWPVLVLAGAAAGGGLSLWQRCLVVGGSVIPAYVTYRWVEEPIRHSRWALTRRGSVTVLAGAVLPVVLVAGLLLFWPRPSLSWPAGGGGDAASGDAAGAGAAAGVLVDPVPGPDGTLTPTLEAARDDFPEVYRTPCHRSHTDPTDVPECVFGDPAGETSVMLLGDSHAAQWQPALVVLAEQNGWRFRSLTRSSCPVSPARIQLGEPFFREYAECGEWVTALQQAVLEESPDLLLLSATTPQSVIDEGGGVLTGEAAERSFGAALQQQWAQWAAQGLPMVVLRDTPWQRVSVPGCLAAASGPADCATARSEALPPTTDVDAAAAVGAPVIDLTDSICGPDACEPIRFNRIVWRDPHHLTASYSEALAPVLRQRLLDHLPATSWRRG